MELVDVIEQYSAELRKHVFTSMHHDGMMGRYKGLDSTTKSLRTLGLGIYRLSQRQELVKLFCRLFLCNNVAILLRYCYYWTSRVPKAVFSDCQRIFNDVKSREIELENKSGDAALVVALHALGKVKYLASFSMWH